MFLRMSKIISVFLKIHHVPNVDREPFTNKTGTSEVDTISRLKKRKVFKIVKGVWHDFIDLS